MFGTWRKRHRTGFLALMGITAIAAGAYSGFAQGAPDLEITTSASGTVVTAGQTITCTITTPSGRSFSQGVWLLGDGSLTGAGPFFGPAPYQFSFTIPVGT